MKTVHDQMNELFKTLKTLHLALFAGMILFLVAIFFVSMNGEMMNDPELEFPLLIMSIVFSITAIVSAKYIFDKRLDEINSEITLSKKIEAYKSAQILKYALHEGPIFLNLVIYLLFCNKIILGITILLILKYIIERPSVEKISKDLFIDEWQA